MKRSIVLILAAGLATIFTFVILMLTITPLVRPTQAEQAAETAPEPPLEIQQALSPEQANQVRVQQAEFEAAAQERETVLKEQITQSQQALAELDQVSQAQITELKAKLTELNTQVEQAASNNQGVQAHMVDLQQAIENDAATYQNQLTTLQTGQSEAERQFQQAIEQTSAQLQTAYNEIATQQAITAAAQQQAYYGGGGGHDDDDHYEGHDDDHEEHEDHDDD